MLIAYKVHLEGKPKEYILDSAPPAKGIAVENFYSHKPDKTANTNLISRVLRVFDKSRKPERIKRIWHTGLQGLKTAG